MSLFLGLGMILACTSDDSKKDGGTDGNPSDAPAEAKMCMMPYGGAVMGMADNHCIDTDGGMIVQPTDPMSCHPPADAGSNDAGGPMYGTTMLNAEGDDDDCKYHVKWTATPLCNGGATTFTLTVTRKTDGKPATGANPYTETVLPPSHLAGGKPTTQEIMPGVYTIGPVIFDQSTSGCSAAAMGKCWYVRFHMFGDCEDTLDTSPHGHAAFFINVP